jgi:cell division protein FtsL
MKKLEESRFFPHVAWVTVVAFALFTYNLTLQVQNELGDINDGINRLDYRLGEIERSVQNSQAQKTQVNP